MKIKVAVVQHACDSDIDKNIAADIRGIENAVSENADLILLPELSSTHYFCITEDSNNFDIAETIPGKTSKIYSALAKQHNIVIVTTLFEKRSKGIYHNTAIVFDNDGSIAGTYRKNHIPNDPGYYEKYYFTQGDDGFKPIDTSVGKLGVMICWDQWYPEAARIMTLAGADLLLFPSAIGWDTNDSNDVQKRELDSWMTIQRAHAIANNLPTIVSNRIGLEKANNHEEQEILFWGSSFIAEQQGELLAEATSDKECVITANLDLNRTDQIRRVWPYLNDRRIDQYDDILKEYIKSN